MASLARLYNRPQPEDCRWVSNINDTCDREHTHQLGNIGQITVVNASTQKESIAPMCLHSVYHLPTQNHEDEAAQNDLDRSIKLPPSLTGQWMNRNEHKPSNQ
jgi:hypothetical protein